MRSKTALVGAVVLAAVLATAGVAGALTAGDTSAQTAPQSQTGQLSNTVTVSGSGQVQAGADRAKVDLVVIATGDDITDVREEVAENASRMRDALAEAGIEDDQIRTQHYDISSDERRHVRPSEEDGPKYRAIHAFTVTVEEPDEVGEVIDVGVNNGASEVGGVEFTLSSEKREQLREQALEAAMDAARSEADTVASAEGLGIGGVDRISTTQHSRSPYTVEAAAVADGGGGGTDISSGPVTVTSEVTVVYQLEG